MNKDMKLIMESWRRFEETATDKETHVFLFENKKPIKTDFNVLLEQYDSKQLTEKQLVKLWEDSFNYEYEQLLKEVDWEKEAALTADPGYKPPRERGGIGEKIRDFILQKSIQLVELAKKGIGVAVKVGKTLLQAVGKFKESHPLVFKVVSVIVISAAMFALMAALDSPEAQAAIMPAGGAETVVPTGEEGGISSGAYEALRGLIHESDVSTEVKTKAMSLIDRAQQSKEVVDLAQMKTEFGQFADERGKTLEGLFKLAKGAGGRERDPEAAEYLLKMIKVGKSVVYKIHGAPTR